MPFNLLRIFFLKLGGVNLGKGVKILNNSYIAKGCIINSYCSIGKYTDLGENVRLGTKTKIGNFSKIENLILGENSHIDSFVITTGHGNGTIKIGKNSYVGIGTLLDFSNNISIGDFVHIAGKSTALHTHSSYKLALEGKSLDSPDRIFGEIEIGNNVWIGGNVTIYPAVRIESTNMVLPNSVVNKNLPTGFMYGGTPAKEIKKLDVKRSIDSDSKF